MPKVTKNQRKFVQGVISGMTQTDAYLAAMPTTKREVAKVGASKCLALPHVRAYHDELMEKSMEGAEKRAIFNKSTALEYLSEIAAGGAGIKAHERVAAISQASRMCGWNDAEKVEVSGLGGLVAKLRSK